MGNKFPKNILHFMHIVNDKETTDARLEYFALHAVIVNDEEIT